MCDFKKFINELDNGFMFEFMYMKVKHRVSSCGDTTYSLISHTKDNYSLRIERKIVNEEVLKEMFDDMENITYFYLDN